MNSAGVRLPALQVLCNLGWRFLSPPACVDLRSGAREVLLKPRLVEFLQGRRFDYKGSSHPLSPAGIDQVLRELTSLGLGDGLLVANERLYVKLTLGITITEFMPDGKKHQPTIPLIDWSNPRANFFDVTEAFRVISVQGTHDRSPDIVCFVNGIPLVVAETTQSDTTHRRGSGHDDVREGIDRHLRNQRDDELPHLFAYAQLLLSISQTTGSYATTRTPARFWSRWDREEEFDDAHMQAVKNARLPPALHAALFEGKPVALREWFESLSEFQVLPSDADRVLVSLLTPKRLLELLRGFVLFDRKAGKIVARHQQFFAVRALLERLSSVRPDGSRQGGVVWHTAGSGKSFTMVFLTKALLLSEELKECRVLAVTDRLDLERQLARNFIAGGAFGASIAAQEEGERSKATTGRGLARRIGQGSERITFALLQKFNTASRLAECRNDSPNIIVLVDEGHRSHGGETHDRMKKVLPKAAYIAFTGTPLLKDEKTANRFGPIVHAYTMLRAVADHMVVPLLYEERVPQLEIDAEAVDRWIDRITAGLADAQRADLKSKLARRSAIYGATNRIQLIAWDIALHFSENIKKITPGLKGQVATASKRDAIRYKQALDDTGLVTSVLVMSPPEMREGCADVDEERMSEVQAWWKQNVSAAGLDASTYEKQALRAFASDGGPDLLIVVDRLLTGFDEPRNAVMYIDKPLKSHGLIQAVARVNRLHDAKRHGLLVDYRGILAELDTALHAYQDLESRTQGGFEVADLAGLYAQIGTEYARLPALHAAMWSFFDEAVDRNDPESLRQSLSPRFARDGAGSEHDERQKLRDDFADAVTAFGQCLKTALSARSFFESPAFPETLIECYKRDLRLLSDVRRLARRDALLTVDYGEHEEQIRKLIDTQVIPREVREPDGRYVVHKLVQVEVPDAWSEEKTRNEADLVRTRLRWTIEHALADDPYAQKAFSELLKDAIAEAGAMFDHPRMQYALFREFEDRVGHRMVPGMPDTLAHDPKARAYFGAILLALGEQATSSLDADERDRYVDHSLAISQVIERASAEHSLDPQGMEAAIRKDLLMRFHATLGLEKTGVVIDHVLQITRLGPSRRS